MAAEINLLRECLEELGMPSILDNFIKEHIDARMIECLSDTDLNRLGVTTIGHRHKLKQLLKSKLENNSENNDLTERLATERGRLFNSLYRCRSTSNNHRSRSSNTRSKARPGVTMHFLCLASRRQNCIPNSAEKEILNNAGLGRKKIRLNKDDSEKDVFDKLTSNEKNDQGDCIGFPKLAGAGGVELLRSTQNCRELKLIDCVWSAKELQRNVNPQATIYVRPIQNNIHITPVVVASNAADAAQHKCSACGCMKIFPLKDLRNHIESCDKVLCEGSNDDDAEEAPNTNIRTETIETVNSQTVVYVLNTVQDEATQEHVSFYPERSDVDNIEMQMGDILEHTENRLTELSDIDHVEVFPDREIDISNRLIGSSDSIVNITHRIVDYCKEHNILDQVEILRKSQKDMVTGRPLDVIDVTQTIEGDTNFILVDRNHLLQTGFDEIKAISDLRKTLEVQFYEEAAMDFGGPRKEFFHLMLLQIKEKYFDTGLRELLFEDYEVVGKIFALSVLQNGQLPTFMDPHIQQRIFSIETDNQCILKLRSGLDALGIYMICKQLPSFVYIFQNNSTPLTFRMLTTLLKPQFAAEGSNNSIMEKRVYSAFLRYLREVASGRREQVSIGKVLLFATGTEEEPVLGFTMQPTITFQEYHHSFLPTANTCINCLSLPRPSHITSLPKDSTLFEIYDYSFTNTYYGLR